MPIKLNNKYGKISIDESVVATIAGISALECYGIVGMAAKNVKDGFFQLLKKESLTKGIKIYLSEENEDAINIELHIIALYGTNIPAIGNTLMETIKFQVETSTGVSVSEINVFVEGIITL